MTDERFEDLVERLLHGDPHDVDGIRRLLVSLLEGAIVDVCGRKIGYRKMDNADAEYWMFVEEGGDPFTFTWVCQHLDLDPVSIRAAVRGFRDNGTKLSTLRSGVVRMSHLLDTSEPAYEIANNRVLRSYG